MSPCLNLEKDTLNIFLNGTLREEEVCTRFCSLYSFKMFAENGNIFANSGIIKKTSELSFYTGVFPRVIHSSCIFNVIFLDIICSCLFVSFQRSVLKTRVE